MTSRQPQRFANPFSPTTLRQPAPSARTSTSTSSPLSVVGGTTQVTPLSSHSMVIRNERDFSLALSIQAAQGDSRECPWYGVWSKVLERYIFHDADGLQTACTCIPQYSLVASHDSGSLPQSSNSGWPDMAMGSHSPDRHSMIPGGPLPGPPLVPYNHTPDISPRSRDIFGGPLPPLTPSPSLPTLVPRYEPYPDSPTVQYVTRLQARRAGNASNIQMGTRPLPQPSSSSYQIPSDGIPPTTPRRPTTRSSDKSSRIPDFVQILEHAQKPFPAVPGHVIRRVIMTVEIKPELREGEKVDWESLWQEQVQEQALHAFEADSTLKYLGVIMAAGRRWVYGTAHRGQLVSRTMSETRDSTFRGTGPQVPSSGNSVVEEVQNFGPSLRIPDFLPKTNDGSLYQFSLLDARGESLRAFKEIVDDLRHKNSDIWI